MTQLHTLTITSAAERIRDLELSPTSLLRACSDRITELDPKLQAWVTIDYEGALLAAANAEKEIKEGHYRGPLHGIPVGIKDIFFTEGIATGMGSSLYSDYVPTYDATTIRLLKQAGAIIVGKTHTTEFAALAPSPTRNPWNLRYTPGGSSSGSAAAVADCMVPLAFGSQTVGSTIRPASYCGIVGYKPSYGLIDRNGMRPMADSFDTVGLFARDVRDVAYMAALLARRPALRLENSLDTPPAVGLCKTHEWQAAAGDTVTAMETAAHLIGEAGGEVRELTLPKSFSQLADAQGLIVDYEVSRSAAHELAVHRDRLSDSFLERANAGLATTANDYDDALSVVAAARADLNAAMDGLQVLLCPSAPGQAPEGLGATGDPIFNRMGTALRGPCLNIPGLHGSSRLPVGVQLIGRMNDDQGALAVGDWLQQILR